MLCFIKRVSPDLRGGGQVVAFPLPCPECSPVPPRPAPHSRLRVSQGGGREVLPHSAFPPHPWRADTGGAEQPWGSVGPLSAPPAAPLTPLIAPPVGLAAPRGELQDRPPCLLPTPQVLGLPVPSWTLRPAPNPRAGGADSSLNLFSLRRARAGGPRPAGYPVPSGGPDRRRVSAEPPLPTAAAAQAGEGDKYFLLHFPSKKINQNL